MLGPMERRRRIRWLAGGILGTVLGSLSFLTICDLSFDCGCCAPGMGDMQHCDIQTAGPPDCPWCARLPIGAAAFLTAAAGALFVARGAERVPFLAIVAASWAGFNLALIAAGILTALLTGRPVLAGL